MHQRAAKPLLESRGIPAFERPSRGRYRWLSRPWKEKEAILTQKNPFRMSRRGHFTVTRFDNQHIRSGGQAIVQDIRIAHVPWSNMYSSKSKQPIPCTGQPCFYPYSPAATTGTPVSLSRSTTKTFG